MQAWEVLVVYVGLPVLSLIGGLMTIKRLADIGMRRKNRKGSENEGASQVKGSDVESSKKQ